MAGSAFRARVLSCLLLAPMPVIGGDTLPPLPGTLVRVTAPTVSAAELVGTLVEITDDDVVLKLRDADQTAVPRAAITRLDMSRGRGGNAVKGLLLGAAAGLLLTGAAFVPECRGTAACPMPDRLFVAGLAAPFVGLAIGAARTTDRWTPVPVREVRATSSALVGRRVRVTVAPEERLVGLLVEIAADAIVLGLSGSERRTVPRADIVGFEVMRGRGGNASRGLKIGAATGAAFGLFVSAGLSEGGVEARNVAGSVLIFAGLGAIPGAGVGALIKSDRWHQVELPNLRVSIAPTRGGGAGLHITWRW